MGKRASASGHRTNSPKTKWMFLRAVVLSLAAAAAVVSPANYWGGSFPVFLFSHVRENPSLVVQSKWSPVVPSCEFNYNGLGQGCRCMKGWGSRHGVL